MHRSLCICALLPRLSTRTRVIMVVHQLEAPKPTNTGVVAARCLENSAVIYRGRAPGEAEVDLLEPHLAPGAEPLLLFPHAEARPLETWRGSQRPVQLIVPDGTWSQAARTRRRLGALHQLLAGLLRDRLGRDALGSARGA